MKNKSIVYEYGNKLYVNLTNRCPCKCSFCIRQFSDTVGDSAELWLKAEPTAAEVIAELGKYELPSFSEVAFCGFGEPTEALDVLLDAAAWLKLSSATTRVDTNGLSDLINEKPTAHLMAGLIDTVSISLNASNAERYNALCLPKFGTASFDGILHFARDCQKNALNVLFTVVDVIGEEEIQSCQKLADSAGIPLRVRTYST